MTGSAPPPRMKSFFRFLFWRNNPKAGAHFSALLSAILLTVVLPVYVHYACFYIWNRRVPALEVAMLAALLYAGLLKALFFWRVFPGCVKRRESKPVLLVFASGLMAITFLLIYFADLRWYLVFDTAFTLMFLFWMMAVNAMQPAPRCKWAWLAPACTALMLVVPDALLPLARQRAERGFDALCHAGGLDALWQDDGSATQDNPLAPYQALDEAYYLHASVQSVLGRQNNSLVLPPQPDEITRYSAFLATNAQLLAHVDTLTDDDAPKTTHNRHGEQIAPISICLGIARAYNLRMFFAIAEEDAATLLDTSRRLENLADALHASPGAINQSVRYAIEAVRILRLMQGLRILPDDALPGLQKQLTDTAPTPNEAKIGMLDEIRRGLDLSGRYHQTLPNFLWQQFNQIRNYLFAAGFLFNYCDTPVIFRDARALFALYDDTSLTAAERHQRTRYFEKNSYGWLRLSGIVRETLPFPYEQWFSNAEYDQAAAIAVAVERYRRQHHALPDALDQLVPGFLQSAPFAMGDDKPFDYEHGRLDIPESGTTHCTVDGFRIQGRALDPAHPHRKTSILVPLDWPEMEDGALPGP